MAITKVTRHNTPAFSAKSSGATSLSNDTSTKILYGSEVLDTDACYASSRFTPTTAGKYFIRGTFRINTATDCNGLKIGIYKNGSADRWHQQSNINYETVEIEGVIDMNGSSDYVEIYGAQDTGGTVTTVNDSTYENFEGYRITGA